VPWRNLAAGVLSTARWSKARLRKTTSHNQLPLPRHRLWKDAPHAKDRDPGGLMIGLKVSISFRPSFVLGKVPSGRSSGSILLVREQSMRAASSSVILAKLFRLAPFSTGTNYPGGVSTATPMLTFRSF